MSLRWQCASGTGGGTATIPAPAQLLMLTCSSDTVQTEIRIDRYDPIIVPANHYFTIGANEFAYHWRWCKDKSDCYATPDCDLYPGEKQITVQFSAENEPGGPLSWFVAWVGC